MEPLTLQKAAEAVRIAADKVGYKKCFVGLNSGDFDLIKPEGAHNDSFPRWFSYNGDLYYDAEATVAQNHFTIVERDSFNAMSHPRIYEKNDYGEFRRVL